MAALLRLVLASSCCIVFANNLVKKSILALAVKVVQGCLYALSVKWP